MPVPVAVPIGVGAVALGVAYLRWKKVQDDNNKGGPVSPGGNNTPNNPNQNVIPNVAGIQAVVTTNDPPPNGDLAIRATPSETGAIVGGAEKNGYVTVVNPTVDAAGVWALIEWKGGPRRPAATGYAHKKYLKLVGAPSVTPIPPGNPVPAVIPIPVPIPQAVPVNLSQIIPLSPVPSRTLRQGMTGADVALWQTFLNSAGYDVGNIDGIYGAKTVAGTIAFQRDNGLTADGIAGPNTFAQAIAMVDPSTLFEA